MVESSIVHGLYNDSSVDIKWRATWKFEGNELLDIGHGEKIRKRVTVANRDREMAKRIMDLVGSGGFDAGGELRVPEICTAEYVVAGLAVVASEVRDAADRIIRRKR